MDYWLIKTALGWCGLIKDGNTIKKLILPSPKKSLVLKKFGKNCNSSYGISKSKRIKQIKQIKRPDVHRGAKSAKSVQSAYYNLLKDLNNYFNGEKVDFRDTKIFTRTDTACRAPTRVRSGRYKIDLRDCSDFEKAVYKVIRTIPYGKIRPYKWVAEKVGCPKGSRAVGNALAKNPLPIIIPCHRVVRSNGFLGGFSAIGGVKLKKRLLEVEGAI